MEPGHNLSETMKSIQSAIKKIRDLKSERSEINDTISSIRENLQALGISKAAFDMALRYLDWEPEKRQGFDLAYSLVREAGGLPIQGDLFAETEKAARAAKEEKRAAEPSAKDIAERMFEQTTRGKKVEEKAADKPKETKPAQEADEPPAAPQSVAAFADAAEKEAEENGKRVQH